MGLSKKEIQAIAKLVAEYSREKERVKNEKKEARELIKYEKNRLQMFNKYKYEMQTIFEYAYSLEDDTMNDYENIDAEYMKDKDPEYLLKLEQLIKFTKELFPELESKHT